MLGKNAVRLPALLAAAVLGGLVLFACASDPYQDFLNKTLLYQATERYADYRGEDAAVLLFRAEDSRSSTFVSPGVCIAIDGKLVFADDSFMLGLAQQVGDLPLAREAPPRVAVPAPQRERRQHR